MRISVKEGNAIANQTAKHHLQLSMLFLLTVGIATQVDQEQQQVQHDVIGGNIPSYAYEGLHTKKFHT
jgi:hypothetical protein